MNALRSVKLGVQFALRATGQGRFRALTLFAVCFLGTWMIGALLARNEWISSVFDIPTDVVYGSIPNVAIPGINAIPEAQLRMLAIVGLGLPIAALLLTIGQLSWPERQARQQRLEKLGMSPSEKRWLVFGETGVPAVLAWLLGIGATMSSELRVLRFDAGPSVGEILAFMTFSGITIAALTVVFPLIAILASTIRSRPTASGLKRSNGPWGSVARVTVLLGGVALLIAARVDPNASLGQGETTASMQQIGGTSTIVFFVGALITGLGVLLVFPLVTSALAPLLTRVGGASGQLVVGRLHMDPTVQTRLLGSLMLALFFATSSVGMATAYQTSQVYRAQALVDDEAPMIDVQLRDDVSDAEGTRALLAIDGVEEVLPLTYFYGRCGGENSGCGFRIIAADCATLRAFFPGLQGCQDGVPALSVRSTTLSEDLALFQGVTEVGIYRVESPLTEPLSTVTVDANQRITLPPGESQYLDYVVVPTGTPGTVGASDAGQQLFIVRGDPNSGYRDEVAALGPSQDEGGGGLADTMDRADNYVAGLQTVMVIIAAAGLGAVGLGVVDRALGQRRDIERLRALGAPQRTLWQIHLIEVGLPLFIGTILAIGFGWFVADSYLAWAGPGYPSAPVSDIAALSGVATLGAIAVALVSGLVATRPLKRATQPGKG